MYPDDTPILQHEFHHKIRWRYDFFWPDVGLALEVQGYGPGHCSPEGMYNDANKNNASIAQGLSIIYCTSRHLQPARIAPFCKIVKHILTLRRNK